jgi:photosystem II stability/assembly factor-like uncharacterized protein
MRTFPRSTAPLLSAAALLLGACANDLPTAAPAAPTVRGAATAAPGAPLLQWAPVPGAVAAYDFAVTSDGRTWAAGDVDGLFFVEPGAVRWQKAASVAEGAIVNAIAASADDLLYAGTNAGVYVSDDRGASWRATGLAEGFVRQVAVDPKGSIYAGVTGMGGGVLRSDDGGIRWTMVLGPFQGRGGIIDWMSIRKSDVLLGLYSQLPMFSHDRGESWDYFFALWELPEWNAFANHMIETSNGSMLVSWARGIAHSVDGGATWKHVYDAAQAHRLVHDDRTGTTYAMLDDGSVIRSTDDGVTWTPHTGPLHRDWAESFSVAADGGLLLGTWKGVWRTVP